MPHDIIGLWEFQYFAILPKDTLTTWSPALPKDPNTNGLFSFYDDGRFYGGEDRSGLKRRKFSVGHWHYTAPVLTFVAYDIGSNLGQPTDSWGSIFSNHAHMYCVVTKVPKEFPDVASTFMIGSNHDSYLYRARKISDTPCDPPDGCWKADGLNAINPLESQN